MQKTVDNIETGDSLKGVKPSYDPVVVQRRVRAALASRGAGMFLEHFSLFLLSFQKR